ncbi:hypothetical protein A1L58_17945 [Shewanella baltica]|uniref:Uncharacterized protein n=1 Tax=Shewanella baltica (strain OS195) TaxID=399599 RepID=A9L6A0_SHEB9|nr:MULTISPECIES: hypothetical protein [Shewanella]ABX51682.1 hypothetical protein Sbal195_4525 [Shewanella baltica OS195]ACK48849.1 hypothetical protein Sbal223_4389 [Shewanella baltica OS223]KZK68635.1 hypothetical protein A1L58_17945 [Shewanella baltica]MCS6116637.1 hypothetical protein [Shewanella baltica]MDT3309267.1 hypothetical protein [Shewanella sp. SP1S1-4]
MNIIKTGALLLCLLSPLAQAETTLFGLTLGKSTLQEVEQSYTLQDKNTASGQSDRRNYYVVDGKQFNEPQLKDAALYFDDAQTLGTILFTFPSSLEKYKALEEQLSRQYPRIKMAPFVSEPLRLDKAEFQNDTTHIRLEYNVYSTFLSFTDLKYRAANQKRLAEKKALEGNKPKKEP